MKKYLAIAITLILLFIISFFIWHFFFSIYEVKYEVRTDSNIIPFNSKFEIKLIGINSFGNELNRRKIKFDYEITKGKDLVKISEKHNSLIIKTLTKEGDFTLKISPELSLNPSIFSYSITNH